MVVQQQMSSGVLSAVDRDEHLHLCMQDEPVDGLAARDGTAVAASASVAVRKIADGTSFDHRIERNPRKP